MSYAFPPDLDRLVQERMATGRYGTQDELLLQAMLALGELEQRHRELRDEIRERLDREGKPGAEPLDVTAFNAEMREQLRSRA